MAVEKFFQLPEIIFQRFKQVALMEGGGWVQQRKDDEILHVEGLCLYFGDPDLASNNVCVAQFPNVQTSFGRIS